MKSKKEYEFVSRDSILKILTDEEAVRVRGRGMATLLIEGDEFIDLAEIERGVQRAGQSIPADVLPRKAVYENTWKKIVTNLNAWKAMIKPYSRPTKQR